MSKQTYDTLIYISIIFLVFKPLLLRRELYRESLLQLSLLSHLSSLNLFNFNSSVICEHHLSFSDLYIILTLKTLDRNRINCAMQTLLMIGPCSNCFQVRSPDGSPGRTSATMSDPITVLLQILCVPAGLVRHVMRRLHKFCAEFI